MPSTIRVKKLHSDVVLPKRQTPGSSGMDLRAFLPENKIVISPGKSALVPTGLSLEIPVGLEAQVRPRSGLALKKSITVLNTPGTIDADYRGEIGIILINHSSEDFEVEDGMRIAQMVFAKVELFDLESVETLAESGRSEGGFGHTGLK